jgi:alkylation response protein AidB-like acyl-CoA dehydrogenase
MEAVPLDLGKQTEPDSRSGGLANRICTAGDDEVINGSKDHIGSVPRPDSVTIFAATGADATPRRPRERPTSSAAPCSAKGESAVVR